MACAQDMAAALDEDLCTGQPLSAIVRDSDSIDHSDMCLADDWIGTNDPDEYIHPAERCGGLWIFSTRNRLGPCEGLGYY